MEDYHRSFCICLVEPSVTLQQLMQSTYDPADIASKLSAALSEGNTWA